MENYQFILANGWNDLGAILLADGYTGSYSWEEFTVVNRSASTLSVKGNQASTPAGGAEGSTYEQDQGQVWDCPKDGVIRGARIFLYSDGGGAVDITFTVKGGA